jgi:hypothetical protein
MPPRGRGAVLCCERTGSSNDNGLGYVDTSKQVGHRDHLKAFVNRDAADEWFGEHDPEDGGVDGTAFTASVARSMSSASWSRCLDSLSNISRLARSVALSRTWAHSAASLRNFIEVRVIVVDSEQIIQRVPFARRWLGPAKEGI